MRDPGYGIPRIITREVRRIILLGSRVNKEFLVCVLAALRDCIGAYP